MSKTAVFHSGADPVKRPLLRPVELTEDELTRLLQAFVAGNPDIVEEDALTLVQWATAQRLGAMVVEMILQGDLVPSVHAGQVLVGLPGHTHAEENSHAP